MVFVTSMKPTIDGSVGLLDEVPSQLLTGKVLLPMSPFVEALAVTLHPDDSKNNYL